MCSHCTAHDRIAWLLYHYNHEQARISLVLSLLLMTFSYQAYDQGIVVLDANGTVSGPEYSSTPQGLGIQSKKKYNGCASAGLALCMTI